MSAPAELLYLCDYLQYKAGWNFSVMEYDSGCTLAIVIHTTDAYHPEVTKSIMHYTPVPAEPPASWAKWLLGRIIRIEAHEACEFFQLEGERPFAPSHEVGEAPYSILDEII